MLSIVAYVQSSLLQEVQLVLGDISIIIKILWYCDINQHNNHIIKKMQLAILLNVDIST